MIYDRYAAVYDGSGQIRFALLLSAYLDEVLRRHQVSGRRLVDLACGTGTLALMMAAQGWQVIGVDRSAAMLAQARAKLEHSPYRHMIDLRQGDMRDVVQLLATADADLVTCTYDSLNYMLSERDLAACFRSAAFALAPGGLLIADMNTQHFLQYDWGECVIHELIDYVQVEQSYFDPQHAIVTMALSCFVGDDEHGYERIDEVHRERAYDDAVVRRLIAEAGLYIEASYDSFTFEPPADATQRIFYIARKPR
ncbi:class I SAM-dependent methyltransferase [Candidatus Gracilibacteria bacterium]|nr:class I SAM-dependent methyltransferase [Candidatus Gracilibacteria bacterium]